MIPVVSIIFFKVVQSLFWVALVTHVNKYSLKGVLGHFLESTMMALRVDVIAHP